MDKDLDKPREQDTAETCLNLLESGQDKLVNITEVIHTNIDEKSEDQVAKLDKEILYNKKRCGRI